MKFTAAVVLGTLVVLLHQMETPLAQYCSAPQCEAGSFLDQYSCKCNNFTKSVCPSGSEDLVGDDGQCSCQIAVHPICPEGYTLNPNLCACKIKATPECPDRTRLVPGNAVCFGVERPYCPKGFKRVGCKCVKTVYRECESGELAEDGCKCKNVDTPTCTGGCTLNSNGKCACEDRRRIQCYYYSETCTGAGVYVNSKEECCYRYPTGYTGDTSVSPPHTADYVAPYSFRVGDDECTSCSLYYYLYTHNHV